RRSLRQLQGKLGVAKTVMLPSGAVLIDGQTIDALSEGPPIEAGQRVRVIEVHGNRVVVRVADDAPASTDDVLSQPIESLGLDGRDAPLAGHCPAGARTMARKGAIRPPGNCPTEAHSLRIPCDDASDR